MKFILFGLLLNQPHTVTYFIRFKTAAECIEQRVFFEKKYGSEEFSGFCVKEVR
jgi:hypothetical protein